jgi:hypothetical protein
MVRGGPTSDGWRPLFKKGDPPAVKFRSGSMPLRMKVLPKACVQAHSTLSPQTSSANTPNKSGALNLVKQQPVTLGPQGADDLFQEIESLKKDEVFKRLDRLQDTAEKTFCEIGCLLLAIRERKLFEPCSTFDEWVRKNTRYGPSTARAMIQVYETVLAAGVSWAEVEVIGWSKFRAIVPFLKEDSAKSKYWIDVAKNQTKVQLLAALKEHLAQVAKEKPAQLAKPMPKTKADGLKEELIKLGAADPTDLTKLIIAVLGSFDQAVAAQVVEAMSAFSTGPSD